jgi:predicted transcriptional regulator of viral defense system
MTFKTAGLRLIERLIETDLPVFTVFEAQEVGEGIDIDRNYTPKLLAAMAETGMVERLRRGIYILSGVFRPIDVPMEMAALRLASPSALGHWAAMAEWGYTDQQSQGATTVVTPGRLPRGNSDTPGERLFTLMGRTVRVVSVDPSLFFGITSVFKNNVYPVDIYDPERAILDAFLFPRAYTGIPGAVAMLRDRLVEDAGGRGIRRRIDLYRLAEYGVRTGRPAVIRRLGWALEGLGAPGRAWAKLFSALPLTGEYTILDPEGDRRGPCNSLWHIVQNAGSLLPEGGLDLGLPQEGMER